MIDIVQDPNGQRMSVRRFRCVHCSHDFTVDVCWGAIETAYKGQCPNCGTLNDGPYYLTSLKNVDASVPIGDKVRLDFSLVNMEYLANKIAQDRGGHVSLSAVYDGRSISGNLEFHLSITDKTEDIASRFTSRGLDDGDIEYTYKSWNDLVDDWDV